MGAAAWRKQIRRGDWLLAAACLLLAAAFALWSHFYFSNERGALLRISVAGQELGCYRLDEDLRLPLEQNGHYNAIIIENGAARVSEADCPDQYCVRHAAIYRVGESIICLPARLVLSVTAEESGVGLDAIAR